MTDSTDTSPDEHFVTPEPEPGVEHLDLSGNASQNMKPTSSGKRTAMQEPENDKDAKARKTEHQDNASHDTPNQDTVTTADATVTTADAASVSSQHMIMAMVNPQGGPPTALPFLTEQQHQQLLQTYAQASGQELANLTASSLAQAMVSPIAVPGLSLLQQLQHGSVITTLPGPLPMPTAAASGAPQNDGSGTGGGGGGDGSDDGQGKRGSSTRGLSNDERRQRRLQRNRQAAKECRKKKKLYIQEMEEKIKHLEQENSQLRKQVDDLTAKVALGAIQGSSESFRLMKQVEELNAKLGISPLPATSNTFTATAVSAATGLPTQPLPPPPSDQAQAQAQAQAQHAEAVPENTNQKDNLAEAIEKSNSQDTSAIPAAKTEHAEK